MKHPLIATIVVATLLAPQGSTLPAARVAVSAAADVTVLQAAPPTRPPYTITDLGTLGGACAGNGMNNLGHVVGRCFTGASSYQAFLWKDGTMVGLGTLGGSSSEAYGVNDADQVVGRSETPNAFSRALLWENGAMHDLGAPTSGISLARAINSSGQAAGTAITPAYQGHAYLWGSGMTDLGGLATGDSQAWGLNDAGQVVGFSVVGVYPDIEHHIFLWQSGSMQDLGAMGFRYGMANAINETGISQVGLWTLFLVNRRPSSGWAAPCRTSASPTASPLTSTMPG